MLCVGEFPMPPEAEGIKSTRDNLSGATIARGIIDGGPQIQTPFLERMTWEGVSVYNDSQHNVQGGGRVTVEARKGVKSFVE